MGARLNQEPRSSGMFLGRRQVSGSQSGIRVRIKSLGRSIVMGWAVKPESFSMGSLLDKRTLWPVL